MSDVDPRQCPLCGGPNECGIAAGASTCWCFSTEIPSDVRDRIPADARDLACVCRACAERQSDASGASGESGESHESGGSSKSGPLAHRQEAR